jgi:hypothetical protein
LASQINASNSGFGGIVSTGDSSGQLQLQTAGTTAVTIDTSQNVGIGTSSPSYNLDVVGNVNGSVTSAVQNSNSGTSGFARFLAIANGGNAQFGMTSTGYTAITGAQDAMLFNSGGASGGIVFAQEGVAQAKIDSSGNLGIGTTSPSGNLFSGTTGGTIQLRLGNNTGANYWGIGRDNVTTGDLVFQGQTTERMRIDSSGNVLAGTTDSATSSGPGIKILPSTTTSQMGIVTNTASNPGTYHVYNTNGTNNGYRFYVLVNGGIANFSANNSNLSDARLKKDITPATNYIDKICSIPVVTFKYKDQGDDELNLGVIAQDVDKVAPELVDHNGFGETPEGETPYLAVYQTDLQYALMKCIQEQQALITSLTARITALEGASL